MSEEGIATRVLASQRLQSALTSISTRAVIESLSGLTSDSQAASIDWNFALFCSSAIPETATEPAQDAALRIAQGCLSSDDASSEQKYAAAVLLERMGNRPALRLAVERQYLDADSWVQVPEPLQLDVMRKRLELSIPLRRGTSVSVNPFQRAFWSAASANSWVSASAPTSAGKSFIVRTWFEDRLAASESVRAVYLVPTRALIEEVSASLKTDPAFSNVGIYTLPWDVSIGTTAKEVFVLTQERLHVLQQRTPGFAASLVFVDEAQKFGDGGRGILLQRVLDESVRRANETQILLASPLTENPELLLDGAPRGADATSVISEGVTVNQNLLWVNQVYRRPRSWRVQLMRSGEPVDVGGFELENRPKPSQRLPLIAVTLGKNATGNIVYVNDAATAEKVANQIFEALGEKADVEVDADISALQELVSFSIHPQYALQRVLARGVAFHYGNMPLLVRNEIERLFRAEKIAFLVCTSTLLEGVNLPCRTLFVRGPRKGPGNVMTPADFWNLAGRAGRWGMEFYGNIVCIDTDNADAWPNPPRVRVRQSLRRASQTVTNDFGRLVTYITEGTDSRESRDWEAAESLYSLLADRVARGIRVADVPGLQLSEDQARALEAVVETSLEGVTLPQQIYGRHAGLSPLSLQRLLNFFAQQEVSDGWRVATPDERDAARSIARALGVCDDHLGASFGVEGRRMQVAILLVNWMRGQPLARLIDERVSFNRSRREPAKVATVIREVMRDVEQVARFLAPKYLGAYSDVLNFYISGGMVDANDDASEDIEMMLELGVSRITEVSLIALGLSRTSAVALSEYIFDDSLNPQQCREWIEARDLRDFALPELVVRDIENAVRTNG